MLLAARRHGIVRRAGAAATSDSDLFTRADSLSVPGSTTGGRAWVSARGTWGISSNQGYTSTSNTTGQGGVMETDFGQANVTVTAEVWNMTVNSTGGGVVFRYVDINNYWLLQLYRNGSGVGQWFLVRTVANVSTNAASGSRAGGSSGTASIVTSGSTITTSVDLATVDTRTDSTFSTATAHGLNIYGSNTIRVDNFSISW